MFRRFFALLGRLSDPPRPPSPRLVEVVNRCDDLEARLEYLHDELKQLRGRFTGRAAHQRRVSREEEEEPQENGGDPVPQGPPAHPAGSAHLATRFRRF